MSIHYSEIGIQFCLDNHISYSLGNLYYRKGIALYFLNDFDHMKYLEASIKLLYYTGNKELVNLYCKVTLKNYQLDLTEFVPQM